MKFLNRRFGFGTLLQSTILYLREAFWQLTSSKGGSFFNKFDGSVDLLDDLDDHWTARTHKAERKYLINSLQNISATHNLRITILSGDVHLAAVGRFYSDVKRGVDPLADQRYMANIISSAIVNKPPPAPVANLLAHRNKIHHMGHKTDETLLSFFDKQPGGKKKAGKNNFVTMPSRNYAMITENSPTNDPELAGNGIVTEPAQQQQQQQQQQDHNQPPVEETRPKSHHSSKSDGRFALHDGEENAGTRHKAASSQHGKGTDGSLDICIRVEIDQHDAQGKTQGYGLTVPVLRYVARPASSSASSSSSQSGQSENQV